MIHRSTTAFACACVAGISATAFAAEYVGPGAPGASLGAPTATDNLRSIPRNAYENNPSVGIPASSLFRDTRAPYYDTLRPLSLSPSVRPGESVRLTSDVDLPDFRGRFPLLQRGFAPDEATLKAGPVYFKLRHLSAGVLWSDNINQTGDNRESDAIAIMSVGGQIMLQLSEGFHVAASGNLVWFPSEGELGLSGFALRAPYSFGLSSSPVAEAQVAWQPVLLGLPFIIADEFRVGLGRYSNGFYDGFSLYDGASFEEADQAGVYTFRSPRNVTGDTFRTSPENNDVEFLYYSNEISLGTGGPLPGQNMFRFRASHEDLWYVDAPDETNLPGQRNQAMFLVESVREDLRFKPFIRYDFLHRDNPERLDHTVRVGVKGPITDLVYFHGEVGHLWQTEQDSERLLWRLGLTHRPGPYTFHTLQWRREAASTNNFSDELDQNLTYRFQKTLGPNLTTTLYSGYHWIEDLEGINPDREEWRNGLRFAYIYSPKTTFRLIGENRHSWDDRPDGDGTSWRARFECNHRLFDRLSTRFIYQHEVVDGDRFSENYYENLLYLTVSWFFE
jgi:hypothetical protein